MQVPNWKPSLQPSLVRVLVASRVGVSIFGQLIGRGSALAQPQAQRVIAILVTGRAEVRCLGVLLTKPIVVPELREVHQLIPSFLDGHVTTTALASTSPPTLPALGRLASNGTTTAPRLLARRRRPLSRSRGIVLNVGCRSGMTNQLGIFELFHDSPSVFVHREVTT